MKIYAPVKTVNGVYASVRFVNGVGETNDPKLIEWFKSRGYRVESPKFIATRKTDENGEQVNLELPDLESMTPIEIREWAIANGLGVKIKNIRSKEKLLNIIRG